MIKGIFSSIASPSEALARYLTSTSYFIPTLCREGLITPGYTQPLTDSCSCLSNSSDLNYVRILSMATAEVQLEPLCSQRGKLLAPGT